MAVIVQGGFFKAVVHNSDLERVLASQSFSGSSAEVDANKSVMNIVKKIPCTQQGRDKGALCASSYFKR